jgi:cytochrome c5
MTTMPTQVAVGRYFSIRSRRVWLTALIIPVVSLGCTLACGQSATSNKSWHESAKPTPPLAVTAATPDPGERKFQANCSRCHNAPEQLSPRITGTVLQHMRVRALISTQDERDILRYLAP